MLVLFRVLLVIIYLVLCYIWYRIGYRTGYDRGYSDRMMDELDRIGNKLFPFGKDGDNKCPTCGQEHK